MRPGLPGRLHRQGLTVNPLDHLGPDHTRAIKLAWIPSHILAIFSHLPQRLVLEATLTADADAVPLVARQLVKLGLVAANLDLGPIAVDDSARATRVLVTRSDRACVLAGDALQADLADVVRRLLQTLFASDEFPELVEDFAFQSATLATLQKITSRMLQTTDVDRALYVMLSGITAGYSLGFNRAALFTYDAAQRCFVGSKAIGPGDGSEAHKIWEEFEFNKRGVDDLLSDYAPGSFDTRFQRTVQSLRLTAEDKPDDEIAQAGAAAGPLLFSRSLCSNRSLRPLAVSPEFALAVLKPHGKTLGMVFADNRFNRAPIAERQLTYLSFFIDQTALVWENLELLKSVERLARFDGLTGLFNRREFELRFHEEAARCVRAGRPCALLLIDVDRFKSINDTHGHASGDDALRRLGELLQRELRLNDLAGRIGGDEFAVFSSDLDREQVLAAARRIGRAARSAEIPVSIGAALWQGATTDPVSMFAAADASLYSAKNAGRGCVCLDGTAPEKFGD
ncbi:MAG: diguanylate cyclase [Deltaproteobacteria bacterium]|nr:diguanylate cyclase [Deltaproteobacteria bacterium]